MRTTPISIRTSAFSLLLISACSTAAPDPDPEPVAAEPGPGVVAVVNGAEITQDDVALTSQPRPGQPVEMDDARRRNLLELTIRRELEAQEAARLGLELGDEERNQLGVLEAAARTYRRTHLAEALEVDRRRRVEVTEAEARAYFEENASRLRSEVNIWQILTRDEARIQSALAELEGGATFEEVAGSRLPPIVEGQNPWDLGFMRWNQVPEPWRESLEDLEPGQSSGIISGLRNRFWIIHVAARRENPAITFETERATIEELLRVERLQTDEAETTRTLRAGARIVYIERPEPAAPVNPHEADEE